jgi:hypothetical protein
VRQFGLEYLEIPWDLLGLLRHSVQSDPSILLRHSLRLGRPIQLVQPGQSRRCRSVLKVHSDPLSPLRRLPPRLRLDPLRQPRLPLHSLQLGPSNLLRRSVQLGRPILSVQQVQSHRSRSDLTVRSDPLRP